MDSSNRYFPPPKRRKAMEAESLACAWDANSLNDELPDELKDISSNNYIPPITDQHSQKDINYFTLPLPTVEHGISNKFASLPTTSRHPSSSHVVNFNEISGQSQFHLGSENIVQLDATLHNVLGIQNNSKIIRPFVQQITSTRIATPPFHPLRQTSQILKTIPQNVSIPPQNVQHSLQLQWPSAQQQANESKQTDVQSNSTLIQNRCLIQKQLILLLHANKCQKGRANGHTDCSSCNIPQCQAMKDVLTHLTGCKEGNFCKVDYCASSRQIIQHWKQCSNNECAVCQPLKLACEKKNASLHPKSFSTPHHMTAQLLPNSNESSSPTIAYSLSSSTVQEKISGQTILSDWRQSYRKEMRDNVVYKFVKCLYPTCGNLKFNELTSIILNIKKLESGIFEMATSREEYHKLLTLKMQSIKMESGRRQQEASKLQENISEFQPTSSIQRQVLDTRFNTVMLGHSVTNSLEHVPGDVDMACATKEESSANMEDIKVTSKSEIMPVKDDSLVVSSSDIIEYTLTVKVWKKDELKSLLLPVLMELYNLEPESFPFRQPVDPILEGVPEYLVIIKKPMDLSTVRNKLENESYEEPWGFIDDMWQIFENAWTFNKKGSRVHKYCTKLSEVFDSMMNVLMKRIGYCCGHKYMFTPIILVCYGKFMCTIPINSTYYTYQNRFSFCEKCFDNVPGDHINLNDDSGQPETRLMKNHFVKMKNGEFEYEKLVECPSCRRKHHPVCCLHLEQFSPSSLRCPSCMKDENGNHNGGGGGADNNKFSAKKLPQTHLSTYLESKVNSFLLRNGCGSREVIIRVLSSSEKHVDVKQGMKKLYAKESKADNMQFNYMAKAIFAFMEDDEVEVCFFGMHVHEYDSKCPQPNSRRAYIAYMDSVNFFYPRHLRTSVYHELLIGYLDYIKKIGFAQAHIWVCPPSEGDDYIFNCHPPNMKIPKQKRLQDWYKKLLDKALMENVIYDYKDLLKDLRERHVSSVTSIPYFEGDYWPSILEEFLKEEEEYQTQMSRNDDDNDSMEVLDEDNGLDGKKRSEGRKKKLRNKPLNKRQLKKEFNDVMSRSFATLEKLKEGFFVVNLHPPKLENQLPEINDPDQCIINDLMDGRDSFLALAREKHFEFSSLRRAKHSTLALLYELHGKVNFTYTCNTCKAVIEGPYYHCNICPDFDLCVACYNSEGHMHDVERFNAENDKKPDDVANSSTQNRLATLNRDLSLLIHIFKCQSAACQMTGCNKMKSIIRHVKSCKLKNEKKCMICRHFLALCCCHAKRCIASNCFVPLCDVIKQKFLLQKKLQEKMLRRRVASVRRDICFVQENENRSFYSLDSYKDRSENVSADLKVQRSSDVFEKKFVKESTINESPKERQIIFNNATQTATNIIGGSENVTPQTSANPQQGMMLLINSNPGNGQGNIQTLSSTDSSQHFVVQLQSNHCLLANAQGEILGVVQMPVIQNQQLLNVNDMAQVINTSSNMIAANRPQDINLNSPTNIRNSPSDFQIVQPSSTSTFTRQLPTERFNGAGQVAAAVSSSSPLKNSSSSALLTFYKTLKSSRLPQHQQLLNLLISDPLKLAKVIKQKQANKVLSSLPQEITPNVSPFHNRLLATTHNTVATHVFPNLQTNSYNRIISPNMACTSSQSLQQHSFNMVSNNPAEVSPSSHHHNQPMMMLDGAASNNFLRISDKGDQFNISVAGYLLPEAMHQMESQNVASIPNDKINEYQFASNSLADQSPEKFLNLQQIQEMMQQNLYANLVNPQEGHSFSVSPGNSVMPQGSGISLSQGGGIFLSQGGGISLSPDLLQRLLMLKEANPQNIFPGQSNNGLITAPSDLYQNTLSNSALNNFMEQHGLGTTSVKNVMLSSQFVSDIPGDRSNVDEQKKMERMKEGKGNDSLQDQLSRYAEGL